jgi:hypothetical protein
VFLRFAGWLSILPPQPGIPAFGFGSHEMREWAGNCGFSRNWFRLHTPNSPNRARKVPKVSDHFREDSRFGETEAGDLGSISHCVPRAAVYFSHVTRPRERAVRVKRQLFAAHLRSSADRTHDRPSDIEHKCFHWYCAISVGLNPRRL